MNYAPGDIQHGANLRPGQQANPSLSGTLNRYDLSLLPFGIAANYVPNDVSNLWLLGHAPIYSPHFAPRKEEFGPRLAGLRRLLIPENATCLPGRAEESRRLCETWGRVHPWCSSCKGDHD